MADKDKLDPEKATDAELTSRSYVVSGAYVLVKTQTPELGPVVVGRYRGSPVPADVDAAWIRHHLQFDLIEPLPAGTPPPPPVAADLPSQVAAQGAPDMTKDHDDDEPKAKPRSGSAGNVRRA